MRLHSLALSLAVVLSIAGCGGNGNTNRCANVMCAAGSTCNLITGLCVPNSGDDGGALPDLSMKKTDAGTADMVTPPTGDMTGMNKDGSTADSSMADLAVSGDLAMPSADLATNADMVSTGDMGSLLGQACAMATPLTFVNKVATVMGDTSLTVNHTSGTCGGITGPDLVYSFTVQAASTVSAVVSPMNSPMFDPVVYIRKVCASEAGVDEVGCNEVGANMPASLTALIDPGTYYVFVDGYFGTMGKFSLTVTLSDPICKAPPMLTFVNNVSTTSVDTTAAVNNINSNCGGATGPDLPFVFTTNAAQRIDAVVTPVASPMYQPVVSIRSACADRNTEIGCGAGAAGMPASMTAFNVPTGTYYVWVDGYVGTSGKSTLTVTLSAPVQPPANDNCAAPAPLALGVPVMADTGPATADMGGMLSMACFGMINENLPGRDLAYVYSAGATAMRTVTLTPMGWDGALWIMPAMCTNTGSACAFASDNFGAGTVETIMFPATANTAYYIVADAWSLGQQGPFTLAIQ